MTVTKSYQVVVIGGGMVGLAFASLMVKAGLHTALIEVEAPNLNRLADLLDARVSAINIAAEHLLKKLEVWCPISLKATPINQMKIKDQQSGAEFEFDSAKLGVSHLGTIIENYSLTKILWENLQAQGKLDFYCPQHPQCLEVNKQSASIRFAEGLELKAELIVGCDGAHSWLRKQMSAGLREKPYEQKSLVAIVQGEEAHRYIAWQNFLKTGPLALLPLTDQHRCALVWSCDFAYADELVQYEEEKFNQALTNASEACLGKLRTLTKVQAIPLHQRHAQHYVQPRLALLGDAAHTIHPLAGQGVNFGLMDVCHLAGLIQEAHLKSRDIGAFKLLRRYERARKSENDVMLKTVGALKSIFGLSTPSLVQLRGMGMHFLNQADCVKKRMARYAMGVRQA